MIILWLYILIDASLAVGGYYYDDDERIFRLTFQSNNCDYYYYSLFISLLTTIILKDIWLMVVVIIMIYSLIRLTTFDDFFLLSVSNMILTLLQWCYHLFLVVFIALSFMLNTVSWERIILFQYKFWMKPAYVAGCVDY